MNLCWVDPGGTTEERKSSMHLHFNMLCRGTRRSTVILMAPNVFDWYVKIFTEHMRGSAMVAALIPKGVYFKGARCKRDKRVPPGHAVFLGESLTNGR